MSCPKYPKYKDSGVDWLGEIPDHWRVSALKHIVSTPITDGPHETPAFLDEGVPFVSAEAVATGTIDFTKIRGFISASDHQRYSEKYCPRIGDVFMVKSGATTGVTAIVETGIDFNIWSPLAAIRCGNQALPRFVLHFLRSRNFQEGVTLNWSFGTQQNIGMGVIENMAIVSPPPSEQLTIASFLDRETAKIDELVAEQRRLIELLKEKRQAVISHAVTKGLNPHASMKPSGIEWLGEVPENWEVKSLRRFSCVVQTGPFGSQLHAEEYVTGATPVVNPVNMVNGKIVPSEGITVTDDVLDRLPHQRLHVGDVIFSRRGELGRCALVTETEDGWLCGTGSMILRLRHTEYHAGYLSYFLSLGLLRQYFESFSIGAIMDSLSSETLLAMPMIVPPVREQAAIVAFVERVSGELDDLSAEAQRAMDLLQERRTALISAAVTGKIDVRGLPETGAA